MLAWFQANDESLSYLFECLGVLLDHLTCGLAVGLVQRLVDVAITHKGSSHQKHVYLYAE